MRKITNVIAIVLLMSLLTGCLYPSEQKSENQIAFEDQVNAVQNAVDRFREEEGGLLPIKTQEADVDIYQKYMVDFSKLKMYMAEPPGSAYEVGGTLQYVIINPETDPTVKVFDLRISQAIQDYYLKLRIYMDSNQYLPFKEQLSTYVFLLDHEKLGYEEAPLVKSPYTGNDLHIVVDQDQNIRIDYTPDLNELLKDKKNAVKKGDDIRTILAKDSLYVPAYSLPYTVDENNQPVFMKK